MDHYVVGLLACGLLAMVLYSVWTKSNESKRKSTQIEGFNEQSCFSLAQQNEQRLKKLTEDVDIIMKMNGDVKLAKQQADINTQSLQKLVEENAENAS